MYYAKIIAMNLPHKIAFAGLGVIAEFFAHSLHTDVEIVTSHSKPDRMLCGQPATHKITQSSVLSSEPEILFITFQAGDKEKIAALKASGKIKKDTLIIVAQNGLQPEKDLMDAFPDNPVAGMIISAQIRYDANDPNNIVIPKQVKYELALLQGEDPGNKLGAIIDTFATNGLTGVKRLDPKVFQAARFEKHFKNMANLASLQVAIDTGTPATYQDGLANTIAREAIAEFYRVYTAFCQGTPPLELAAIQTMAVNYATTDHIPTTAANYHNKKPIESLTQPILKMADELGISRDTLPTIVRFDGIINGYNQSLK